MATLGAFKEVEEAREYPLKFTLDLDSAPPANDWSDDDFDYTQPQLKPGGSTAPDDNAIRVNPLRRVAVENGGVLGDDLLHLLFLLSP